MRGRNQAARGNVGSGETWGECSEVGNDEADQVWADVSFNELALLAEARRLAALGNRRLSAREVGFYTRLGCLARIDWERRPSEVRLRERLRELEQAQRADGRSASASANDDIETSQIKIPRQSRDAVA